MNILETINQTNWCEYDTAYGSAGRTDSEYANIPKNLQQLFSKDKEQSMLATHHLWCSLCHQHAYVSSAALPAYEVIFYGLETLDDKLKVEILDIFAGFAVCTDKKSPPDSWEGQLRAKLVRDKPVFQELMSNPNESIAYFAEMICHEL